MEDIRIAIIEDEDAHREFLISCITRFFEEHGIAFSLDSYRNVDCFPFDTPYSLIFLDIVVFDKNGFELSKKIRERYSEEETILIFVTSLLNYAVEGYSVGASSYIVKPYTYENFALKLSPIVGKLTAMKDETIAVYARDKSLIPVKLSAILYISSSGHYLTYHTKNGEFEVRQTIKECSSSLEGKGFFLINNGLIVNLGNISSVSGESVEIGGVSLPISRLRKKEFLLEFAKRYGI